MKLTEAEHIELIKDIANRAGTVAELCSWYGMSRAQLERFLEDNREAIEEEANGGAEPAQESTEPTPTQLEDLWITNKFERLKRLQDIADMAIEYMKTEGADQAMMREARSMMMLASNELGQLLHRGSGDSAGTDTLNVVFDGIDTEVLK
jgi:small-conductance mechanosensitive channel